MSDDEALFALFGESVPQVISRESWRHKNDWKITRQSVRHPPIRQSHVKSYRTAFPLPATRQTVGRASERYLISVLIRMPFPSILPLLLSSNNSRRLLCLFLV